MFHQLNQIFWQITAKAIDPGEFSTSLNPFHNLDNIKDIYDVIRLFAVTITGLASLIALGYLVYGGYQYITSMGNPESSKTAVSTITWSVIGLIIVLVAFMIVEFVVNFLQG